MEGKYYNIEEVYKIKDKYITITKQPRRQMTNYNEDDLIDSIQNLYGEPTIYETSHEPTNLKSSINNL